MVLILEYKFMLCFNKLHEKKENIHFLELDKFNLGQG